MSFLAYCFACERKVTAHTLLSADDVLAALNTGDDVEVMHVSDNGDHRWRLNWQEKGNLLQLLQKGNTETGGVGSSGIN
jgi:hypothetical protein